MKPLTLALMGLEPQDAETFRDAFRQLPREQTGKWRVLDDDSDAAADLTVVDIDSIYGHMDWLKATSAGSRTAVYTTAQNPQESDLVLAKPLRAEQLAEVLVQVIAELDGSAVAAPAAPVASDPEPAAPRPEVAREPAERPGDSDSEPAAQPAAPAPAPRRARPSTTRVEARRAAEVPAQPAPQPEPQVAEPVALETAAVAEPPPPVAANLGERLRAGDFKQPCRIRSAGQEWILDPEQDAYHGPTGLKPLVAAFADAPESAEPVDQATLEAARKQALQPLSRLRWVAGMHASPGHLLPELREARSFKLARWPQIEREFPRHFRIATAMMKQAGDLDEIVSASGAPREDVIDFINAYHTLGIIEVELDQEPLADSQRAGVMSRFRKPFGR